MRRSMIDPFRQILVRLASMEISRRLFLSMSATIAIGACNSDSSSSPTSATPEQAPESVASPAPTTVKVATTTPVTEATAAERTLPSDPFTLGVASGDPDTNSVVLWTRLALDPLNGGGMSAGDIEVTWELATDEGFADIVASGVELATGTQGHSVHALAAPATTSSLGFYYRFRAAGFTSQSGRTQLAPDGQTASARFVSASCQNYEDGLYAAHRDIAEQSPDFVVWLGDYIYEGAGSPAGSTTAVRSHDDSEPMDLVAYRNRYALYKSDAQLQASHAACPWFIVWDDHEVENNYAGVTPQDPADAADFGVRRQAAYQAWWEHQPVRLPPPPAQGDYAIYRAVAWGDLIGIALLDTRQYRSDQGCNDATLNLDPACSDLDDPTRTLTGETQEQWLFNTIGKQGTTWNVIGQQIVMADITFNGAVLNYDQWDGYPQARQRILQHLADQSVANVIVLSGDIHLAGVAILRAGATAVGQAVAVEFVDTSISSGGLIDESLVNLVKAFPDIVDVELAHRGYTLHTVTPTAWSAEYRTVDDITAASSPVSVYRTFVVDAGTAAVRA